VSNSSSEAGLLELYKLFLQPDMKRAHNDIGGHDGSDCALKRVEVDLFRKKRLIGDFEKSIVTDILSTVEMCRRQVTGKGREMSITEDRRHLVEKALSGSEFGSLAGLQAAVKAWHKEFHDAWDADKHYDARRAEAYTQHNAVPQRVLTNRALEIAAVPTFLENEIALDLGGGTGLSATELQRRGAWVLNVDLSSHMLQASTAEVGPTLVLKFSLFALVLTCPGRVRTLYAWTSGRPSLFEQECSIGLSVCLCSITCALTSLIRGEGSIQNEIQLIRHSTNMYVIHS